MTRTGQWLYGWLLLVSSWARRATFLWAVLPFFAISVLEKIALNSTHFASMLKYRFMGFAAEAFALNAVYIGVSALVFLALLNSARRVGSLLQTGE